MKKIMIILLVLLLTGMTCSAAGLRKTFECDNGDSLRYYTGEDNTVRITAHYGKATELVIPDMIDEKPVTGIDDGAFRNSAFKTVTLPQSLQYIGQNVFYDCSDLSSIEIPASVKTIGARAFSFCTALETVHLPEGLEQIENETFSYCSRLSSVEIPGSVASINSEAFQSCKNLKSIALPDGVISIGYMAFGDCASLSEITLPSGLKEIGDSAFWQCGALAQIEFPDSLKSIGKLAFTGCSELRAISIPADVESIGAGAFAGLQLDSFELPEDQDRFAVVDGVLYDNSEGRLISCVLPTKTPETLILPPGTKGISGYAFLSCDRLTSVTLPEGVQIIADSAFEGCSALEEVNLPASVMQIREDAFAGCPSLRLLVERDSYAAQYAKENKLAYAYSDGKGEPMSEGMRTFLLSLAVAFLGVCFWYAASWRKDTLRQILSKYRRPRHTEAGR